MITRKLALYLIACVVFGVTMAVVGLSTLLKAKEEREKLTHVGHEKLHADFEKALEYGQLGDFIFCEGDAEITWLVVSNKAPEKLGLSRTYGKGVTDREISLLAYRHCELARFGTLRYAELARLQLFGFSNELYGSGSL